MTLAPAQWGNFLDSIPPSSEFLTLNFSLAQDKRLQRWRNYGLSADFLGDYFATFFPGSDGLDHPLSLKDTIKGSVSYIANELLENAVKYSAPAGPYSITITLRLYDHSIIFETQNVAPRPRAIAYQTFVQTLLTGDPQQLYLDQLEKSALENGDISHIGLLTMINDYHAQFGWQFSPLADNDHLIRVTVMAHLDLTLA